MTAVDTSVIVPALVSWHQHHRQAVDAASGAVAPGHAYLESFSVLTRMPRGVAADVAVGALRGRFPHERVLDLGSLTHSALVERCLEAGIDGGSTYDALIALTAWEHGHELATRDRRAARTYERLGVPVAWVG